MKNTSLFLKAALFVVFIADLYFVFRNQTELRFFTKTLLLPLLIFIYIVDAQNRRISLNKIFISGLALSFFGDLFLLFKWGFLPGLGSFLLVHVLYIFCFVKLKNRKPAKLLVLILLSYLVGFITVLFPHLNEMKIPVILYGIVISTMLYFAVRTGNKLLVLGALLFVISDTVLAINLFYEERISYSLAVMITYIAAQWFLVRGMLSNPKNLQNSGIQIRESCKKLGFKSKKVVFLNHKIIHYD